jgi:lipopolysaccharide/colanic/teichoic acid biosynthesis glycosyltransferase
MALTTLEDAAPASASPRKRATRAGARTRRGLRGPRSAARAVAADWTQRVFDIFVIAATAPLTLAVMAIAAALIWREDRGPILFHQPRIGRHGRIFQIYKLRTMRVAAGGEATTAENDARVTRVGRVLRRYRIDELPQIFNVLRGEMSVVGPRPEVVELSQRYSARIPHYTLRHHVRPGLTGWAQVRQGYTSTLDAAVVKLRLDLYYVFNRSLWLDLKILILTLGTLVRGAGAR